jgi:hypothetical protein
LITIMCLLAGALDDLDKPVRLGQIPKNPHIDAARAFIERDRLAHELHKIALPAWRDPAVQM